MIINTACNFGKHQTLFDELSARLNSVIKERDELLNKAEQLNKYAQLGRLAVDLHGYICTTEGFGKWEECTGDCKFIGFCQKRAELQKVVKDET